ncbi:MAG TPA: glycoside hydrolase, partial [Actinobacteria bacterium]|nr:glycoside hydrolase [Actinomycetota bacterium]
MMKHLGICGHYGSHENINGQMVKTRILTDELTNYFGKDEVELVDSFGWKKHPFGLLYECVRLSIRCRNILILP